MSEVLPQFIGGERVGVDAPGESPNPSNTNDVVARVPKGGEAEVNAAVEAARKAFPAWSEASPELRSDLLDKVGDEIMKRRQEIGRLLVKKSSYGAREQGFAAIEFYTQTKTAYSWA